MLFYNSSFESKMSNMEQFAIKLCFYDNDCYFSSSPILSPLSDHTCHSWVIIIINIVGVCFALVQVNNF